MTYSAIVVCGFISVLAIGIWIGFIHKSLINQHKAQAQRHKDTIDRINQVLQVLYLQNLDEPYDDEQDHTRDG